MTQNDGGRIQAYLLVKPSLAMQAYMNRTENKVVFVVLSICLKIHPMYYVYATRHLLAE